MKKKIILFLSFLMTIMLLTGCSTKVTSEEIEKMTKIAEEIKANPTDYKLPEGYSVSNVDDTKLGRIVIAAKAETNEEETLYISFDITKDKVQIIQIEETYDKNLIDITYFEIAVFVLFAIICLQKYSKIKKKLE